MGEEFQNATFLCAARHLFTFERPRCVRIHVQFNIFVLTIHCTYRLSDLIAICESPYARTNVMCFLTTLDAGSSWTTSLCFNTGWQHSVIQNWTTCIRTRVHRTEIRQPHVCIGWEQCDVHIHVCIYTAVDRAQGAFDAMINCTYIMHCTQCKPCNFTICTCITCTPQCYICICDARIIFENWEGFPGPKLQNFEYYTCTYNIVLAWRSNENIQYIIEYTYNVHC